MGALQNFMVTFGVMYRHEKHPHWSGAHPDGWLEIVAQDEDEARALAHRYLGRFYAFIYPADRFQKKWHPLGRLATVTVDGVLWPKEGVEPPTPRERSVTVSWYETTHYSAELDVPEDFDLGADDADQRLEELICDLASEQMDKAFNGTTDRQITHKEEA